MVKGIKSYGDKQRREIRRRNHEERDVVKRQRRLERRVADEEMFKFNKKDWFGYETEE